MNRILLLLISFVCATAAQAQWQGDGYYRVKNVATKRYITAIDGYGKIDMTGRTVDATALKTIHEDKADEVLANPASIIYIKKSSTLSSGFTCNLYCQGIYSYDYFAKELSIWDNEDGTYRAYASKSFLTLYLQDQVPTPWATGNAKYYAYVVSTEDPSRNGVDWLMQPLSADNYLGVLPDVTVGSDYYKTLCVSFPYTTLSDGMSVYTISAVDEQKAVAVISELTGTVPGGTPVIVKCASSDFSQNRLSIVGEPTMNHKVKPITSANNALKGVYFCNPQTNEHRDVIAYDANTMRVLGTSADGQLAFVKATGLEYIPANSCFITVSATAPDVLLVVDKMPDDPQPVAGDLNGDGVVDVDDVAECARMILKKHEWTTAADMNGDGVVDVDDLAAIVKIILKK